MNEENSHPGTADSSRQEHRARSARLVDMPLAGLVISVVVFFGLAAALASIGGWASIIAVLCLAVLWIAGVVLASDA